MPGLGTIARVVMLLSIAAPPVWAQSGALEYDVKAAFLLNFSRYVEWPSTRLATPFRMCLLGQNPFGNRLETVLAGELWQGAAIEVERVDSVEDARHCHLLYVPARTTDRFVDNANELSDQPVLTIGETHRFLSQGGMIHLFLEGNKVRFSINQASAAAVGLQISSRLLRLAREVVPSRDDRW